VGIQRVLSSPGAEAKQVVGDVENAKDERMNHASIFLRCGSVLPSGCILQGKTICDGWISVNSESANEVDAWLRAANWHFMWLTLVSSRIGIGLTSDIAIGNAKLAALYGLNRRFNAAELITATVRRYLGFCVARVRLASRHIQECASLGLVDEAIFRQFPNGAAPQAR